MVGCLGSKYHKILVSSQPFRCFKTGFCRIP